MVVYFVQRAKDNAIKIGHTDCFQNRVRRLKSELQMPVDVLCIIDGGRPIEKALHAQFSKTRIDGEWFLPENDLTMYINNLKENAMDIKKTIDEKIPGRHINVVISDEAGAVLDEYRDKLGLKSLDNAMDRFLIESKKEESPLARA